MSSSPEVTLLIEDADLRTFVASTLRQAGFAVVALETVRGGRGYRWVSHDADDLDPPTPAPPVPVQRP